MPPVDEKEYKGPEDPMQTHAFNELKSIQIGQLRDIPDARPSVCRSIESVNLILSLVHVVACTCTHDLFSDMVMTCPSRR